MPRPIRLLACVSHHGLGHLAQVGPVLRALQALHPNLHFTVRCTAPLARQQELLGVPFEAEHEADDFGLLMAGSLDVRVAETLAAYRDLHARLPAAVDACTEALARHEPDLILSDCAYLPLLAARRLARPSVLLGSFTWAHALAAYCGDTPDARAVQEEMLAAYRSASLHLAPEPSMPMPELPAAQPIGPLARRGTRRREELAARLGITEDTRVVLLFMGGVPTRLPLADWPRHEGVVWVVSHSEVPERADMFGSGETGLEWLDLLASADALVTKPGYGSITEAVCNAVPVVFVRRGAWPEEPGLITWLRARGVGVEVTREALSQGDLGEALAGVWVALRPHAPAPTGGDDAARAIVGLLGLSRS
jgi:hypothetical protein